MRDTEIIIIVVVSLILMIILAVASLLKIKYRSNSSIRTEKTSVGLDSVLPSPVDGFSLLMKSKSPAAIIAEQRAHSFIERAKSERIQVPNFRSKPSRPRRSISSNMFELASNITDEQSLATPISRSENLEIHKITNIV
mmetsp:Transcript_146/g.122  ORF Transcript_146/g.122 Transcript_146/m.122 type:complete len:139 (-) Transcript_146:74-490(-)